MIREREPHWLYPPTRRHLWLYRRMKRYGTDLTFKGNVYRGLAEVEAGSHVGTSWLESATLGPFSAKFDPHRFGFVALEFEPYTETVAPVVGEIIGWHGREYTITNVTAVDQGDDTLVVWCFAFRSL